MKFRWNILKDAQIAPTLAQHLIDLLNGSPAFGLPNGHNLALAVTIMMVEAFCLHFRVVDGRLCLVRTPTPSHEYDSKVIMSLARVMAWIDGDFRGVQEAPQNVILGSHEKETHHAAEWPIWAFSDCFYEQDTARPYVFPPELKAMLKAPTGSLNAERLTICKTEVLELMERQYKYRYGKRPEKASRRAMLAMATGPNRADRIIESGARALHHIMQDPEMAAGAQAAIQMAQQMSPTSA